MCYITQDIEGEILRKVTRKYLEELFGKELTEEEFTMVALHTNFSGMRQELSLPASKT